MSSRASQQDAVYAAEAACDRGPAVTDLQGWCNELTQQWWWPEHIPYLEGYVVPGRSFSVGGVNDDGSGHVEMLPQHLTQRTLCHEVAHVWAESLCATDERAAHGPLFVRKYLTLVYHVMGSESYVALREAMVSGGVDVGEYLDI